MRAAAMVVLIGLGATTATTASAEPWHRGRYGTHRIVHLSITVTGGLLYPATEFVQRDLEASACRWCSPTGIDREAREALRWGGSAAARSLSDFGAYVITPGASIGLVLAGTLSVERTWARVIDDVTPIFESMVVTQWLTRGMKLGIGRERPDAHYGDAAGTEANLSFPSGHTSTAFAFAASAAMIARARGYRTEPLVWAGGMAVAATTGYLRIAADRHYLTDVLAGAALGTGIGLGVPFLMHRCDTAVVPTRAGVAIVGAW